MNFNFTHRPRRLRNNPILRSLISESSLRHSDFVLPVFISEQAVEPEPIPSMPEIFRWPLKHLIPQIKKWRDLGISSFAIFPQIEDSKKDASGSEFLNSSSLIFKAALEIKSAISDVALISDIALDPYTLHGHDGILDSTGNIDNDSTVETLAKGAILAAKSGYDLVAPSDMMDGRIKIIRNELENNNFPNIGIISYSAKYSSSYYGPFREAIGSMGTTPLDKSTYQLSAANFREAKRELQLDLQEGADILMVKPAEPCLDIIHYARNNFDVPIAAYQVSGEYSRIWAAHLQGWLDLESCAMESIISIKRAGADIIFSYFTEKLIQQI